MQITKTAVGSMDNNAYLLSDGDEAILIDAPAEASVLLGLLAGRRLTAVVTTHRHHDHVGALADVVAATGAQHLAGRPDAAAITEATGVRVDRALWDGDTVTVGRIALRVIGLVGHTPGSIALAYTPDAAPAVLFTGDSLFPGGLGKTWAAEDFDTLYRDVTTKIFDVFGDDTLVHPGHGASTTVGAERPQVASWLARRW